MEQFSYLERFKKKNIPKNRKGIFVVNPIKETEKEKVEVKKENAEPEKKEESEKEEPKEDEEQETKEKVEPETERKEEPDNEPKDTEEPEKEIKIPQFEIIDKRKSLNNKINRMNILKHIRENGAKPEVEPEPIVIAQPQEPNKLDEIVAEREVEVIKIKKTKKVKVVDDKEPLPLQEAVVDKPIKKKVVKTKEVLMVPFKNVLINGETISSRLPKPREKVIHKTSTYYMNNRKIAIEKLNNLFHPYRAEIAENIETASCNSKEVDFDLLTHQKIVRDYLNLFTPYRGLLLYHGLGAGKTCTSIGIAEGMKSDKKIIIMTPASLKMNFFSELKKCGDHLFRKNQYWEFVSTVGETDEFKNALFSALSIPKSEGDAFIKKYNVIWFVDVSKPANFTTLSANDQKTIDEQLNLMIRSKYQDINYNGLNKNKVNELTQDRTINPFDNSVVIIDEAHNFVSRIVNKIDKPNSISYILYDNLMKATNARIVLLTGTPIINYPNEIGILYNILRGYIKTWTIPLNVKTNKKINRDTILSMFDKEKFNTYDYVEYSGNKLIITRNPFGFINDKQNKKKAQGGGAKKKEKSDKSNVAEKDESGSEEFNQHLMAQANGREFPGLDEPSYVWGGNVFDKYSGVKLDDTGNISDTDFLRTIIRILSKNEIDVMEGAIKVDYNKALPDDPESFQEIFVNQDTVSIKNENLFKKRILGLTSYFRSAQEKLLPSFVKGEDGGNYHLVESEMSQYQFDTYEKIRKDEYEQEKKSKKNAKKKQSEEDMYNVSSTYRIFSRAACNFAFPKPPGRPMPDKKGEKDIDESEFDAIPADFLQETNDYADIEDQDTLKSESEPAIEYNQRIQLALKFLKDNASEYLSPDALEIYSPKFLQILENLQDPENEGLHLIYSNFRTIEGVGILKLILEANGFAQFKIQKKTTGDWEIIQSDEDINKPKFFLYTGTETAEEKEILRNIYNSQWGFVPSSIVDKLKETAENNYMGEIVKIMMITSSGAEGINLRNTRFVHIVEPYWHMVRLEQVIGRARRICSHEDLPEELRTVKVFLYMTTLSEEQSTNEKNKELIIRDVSRIDKKTPLTTDEYLYEIARIKNNINQQLLKAVKESSIDCSLHTAGSNENLVCYGYGKVESNQFGSYPTLQEDKNQKDEMNVAVKKLTLVKITVEGTDYAYDKANNVVYDMESYKRSKQTGEALIYVGKIVKQGRKNVVDTTAPM
jgi:D-ribose pyranose/furanose isomerase RbsD